MGPPGETSVKVAYTPSEGNFTYYLFEVHKPGDGECQESYFGFFCFSSSISSMDAHFKGVGWHADEARVGCEMGRTLRVVCESGWDFFGWAKVLFTLKGLTLKNIRAMN